MFKSYVDEAINMLTPKAQKMLSSEVVLTIEKMCDALPNQPNWGVLARFKGTRKGEPRLIPPKIELFQEDIEFANRKSSDKIMKQHIANIIAHELLHYLGANEDYANKFKDTMLKELDIKVKFKKKPWWKL